MRPPPNDMMESLGKDLFWRSAQRAGRPPLDQEESIGNSDLLVLNSLLSAQLLDEHPI